MGSPPATSPPAAPSSTYRLQIRPGFDLHAAADACDYLAALGVGALYLSPLLPAGAGSDHGYDVVDFDRIDAARGGADGWTRLLAAAHARHLGVIVDIVPNHTGVAVPIENPAWWDLLRNGRSSAFASWFDVDWAVGRLRLPVLGDDFEPSQLLVDGDELRYLDHRFPVAPGTAQAGESGADVHDRQHYELIHHRRADAELNYRRFFAVSSLAGLRVEDGDSCDSAGVAAGAGSVFTATHAQILRWVLEDGVDGLRVDHPDGLADPLGYLTRLRSAVGPDTWLTVEKILAPGEELPAGWPVDGTTGYDALAEVSALFVDAAAEAALTETYRELTGDQRTFAEHARSGKRDVATTILRAEVTRLARLFPEEPFAAEALTELLVAFPVYRSYLPDGLGHLTEAAELAIAARPDLAKTIKGLAVPLADPGTEAAVRFQQTSGAVMAKGVEDTAYYRYTRFVAVNEVGADPARIGGSVEQFHAAQIRRQRSAARSMTTLSTHDTKRGEDVRARLAVLSELPGQWAALAGSLMAAAPLPDPGLGYLLWQTFVGTGGPRADVGGYACGTLGTAAGTGLIERARAHGYAEKAIREAATSTGWLDPDPAFESAVHAVVDRAYDDPRLGEPLVAFIAQITPYGWTNSLSQKLVQLTMPGVPDVYQGTARWNDALVDPDNRRPVDFAAARAALDRLDAAGHAPPIDASGDAKLWVVSRALRLRRDRPGLFDRYAPLVTSGPAGRHAVAYDRGGAITVATRLPVGLERDGGWRETTLTVSGAATDVISGVRHAGEIALADLLAEYPVALLVR
jgi:(1->4)-alpha-D-glucan 1-alpha-D-glucosylmutase